MLVPCSKGHLRWGAKVMAMPTYFINAHHHTSGAYHSGVTHHLQQGLLPGEAESSVGTVQQSPQSTEKNNEEYLHS
jgi:hypothetical protein